MQEALRLCNYPPETVRSYTGGIADFDQFGPEHIRLYLLYPFFWKKGGSFVFEYSFCSV